MTDEPNNKPDKKGQRKFANALVRQAYAALDAGGLSAAAELTATRQLQWAFRSGREMGFKLDIETKSGAVSGAPVVAERAAA